MIIFGTRSTVLNGSTAITDCSYCNSTQTMRFGFLLTYFHIFWIPMFPISKKGLSQCSHCKQVLYDNQMPSALQAVCIEEKKKVKTPWGYKIGFILIGIFVLLIIASVITDIARR